MRALPRPTYLSAEVVRIVSAGIADRRCYIVAVDLEGKGKIACHGPFSSQLGIVCRAPAAASRRARDGHSGLRVHGIVDCLAPQHARCRQQADVRSGSQRQRRLEVNEVHVTGVPGKSDVVAIGEQRIECFEAIVARIVISRSRIELQPEAWSPRGGLECIARK